MVTISTRVVRRGPAYLGGRGDAVEAGHLDVEQRHVGPVLEHGGEYGVAGPDLGDDLQVGLEPEQGRQGAAHEGLVVGEQQPDAHGRTTCSEKPGERWRTTTVGADRRPRVRAGRAARALGAGAAGAVVGTSALVASAGPRRTRARSAGSRW